MVSRVLSIGTSKPEALPEPSSASQAKASLEVQGSADLAEESASIRQGLNFIGLLCGGFRRI